MKVFRTILGTEHGAFLVHAKHENQKVLDIALHPTLGDMIFGKLEIEMCMLKEFVDRVEKLMIEADVS
jgi:hypothetical protein